LFNSSDYCEEDVMADVVGYGDIHNAFIQNFNGKTLFNVGSVGNPLEITQSSYAILEGEYNGLYPSPFSVQLVRVPYDIELAVRQAIEAEMPDLEPYIVELRTGEYRGSRKAK
jgi:protein phosphatase